MLHQTIIDAIDTSPLNRGLSGVDWVTEPGNIAVERGGDITLFDDEGEGAYQMHVLYNSRGRAAIDAATAAINEIFDSHSAAIVFALIPNFRRDVKLLARWTGLHYYGKRMTADGLCELFGTTKECWNRGNERWAS